jgi:hypothetical protein
MQRYAVWFGGSMLASTVSIFAVLLQAATFLLKTYFLPVFPILVLA